MSPRKRVVVTGGGGFIGSHLVERLLAEGHWVTILDNFSTGKWENLDAVRRSPRLSIGEVDCSEIDAMGPYFRQADWVFHLAALADIIPSIQRPLTYHQANVTGSLAVLEAARSACVKRFLYAASSSCYGIPDVTPTSETAPIRPMYPYALTKWIAEEYVLQWERIYHLPTVSLRLFNVYGPRARSTGAYGAAFGVFLAQKLAGKPFTVVGDGTQTRDFIFVSDVVEAFLRAAESDLRGEVLNVGTGTPQSVNHLVSLLGGEVVHVPKRPGEPDCTCADISRMTSRLGWRPQVSFEEGVRIMLEHIEEWRNAPVWDEESIAEVTHDWFYYLGNGRASEATRS